MRGYDKQTLARAKLLRRDLTDSEKKLWRLLRSSQINGAKFRRQQPIGRFIADFACHDARLIVEADGGQHANVAADERRSDFLRSTGYRVLRFWNNDILGNPEGVLQVIVEALATPHPAPAWPESPSPSRGEGNGASDG